MGERLSGTASLAVPILDVSGYVTATLSIATIIERMTPGEIVRYAELMRGAAAKLSYQS